jgi:hypothetical protein
VAALKLFLKRRMGLLLSSNFLSQGIKKYESKNTTNRR